MRRSSAVIAPLLASAAVALLASCNSSEPQRCVDENNRVVDPSFCKNLPGNGQPVAGGLGNNGGYYNNGIFIPHFYRYYYGGIGGGFGSVLSGGSYAPLSGHSYSVSGTTRNGFGSSFGGGEGGEGGGGE